MQKHLNCKILGSKNKRFSKNMYFGKNLDRENGRQRKTADRLTDRHTDRQIHGQTDGQTDRQNKKVLGLPVLGLQVIKSIIKIHSDFYCFVYRAVLLYLSPS